MIRPTITLRVNAPQYATALRLGDGNVSEGVRRALDRAGRAKVAAALLSAPAGHGGDPCDFRTAIGREYLRTRRTSDTPAEGGDAT